MRVLVACVGLILALALAAPALAGETVNINEASAKELKGLTGVGNVIAERIIEYRQSHDGFDSVAQLQEVKGIGSATLDDIEDRVTAGG